MRATISVPWPRVRGVEAFTLVPALPLAEHISTSLWPLACSSAFRRD